jgi:hypothetical protein
MALDRRTFLARAGLSAAASGLVSRSSPAATALFSAAGDLDWTAVRALFNLSPDWIHLACFYLVSHPKPVREAIDEYRRRLDANPMWLEEVMFAEGHEHMQDRLKATIAAYVGGRPEEIALVPNTTTGLALLYNGLRLKPGQEILTTEHDHYSHHESIRLASDKNGASVRRIALHDGAARANASEMVDRLRRAITPRTRAVGLTWVHSSTGLRLPIAALAEVVKAAKAGRDEADRCLLIVDGVHGFGCSDAAAATLGCDFFAAGKSGSSGRAAPGSSGAAPRPGRTRGPRSRASTRSGPSHAGKRISRSTRRPGPAGSPPAASTPTSTTGRSRRRSACTRSSGALVWPPASPSSTAASAPRWRA